MPRTIAKARVADALRDEVLKAQLAADNAAVTVAQRLDAWANAVFPYTIGDVMVVGRGTGRVVSFSGKMDNRPRGERPVVVVTVKLLKKDGSDSLRYQRYVYWYPEENA